MIMLANVGKVRDSYVLEEDSEHLVVVATDRVSAYDRVMSEGILHKGLVLTATSMFWFNELARLLPTQSPVLLSSQALDQLGLDDCVLGRTTEVKKADMVPVECVVRGFLAGSAWQEYKAYQSIGGRPAPTKLTLGDRLAEPIFTPTTKEQKGHDVALSLSELRDKVGTNLATQLEELSLQIYERALVVAMEKDLVIADTKFEFGYIGGALSLCDEVLTPDSSRYWRADSVRSGVEPVQFDKQILRDWLFQNSWSGDGEPPHLPEVLRSQISRSYISIYESLTGSNFLDWPGSGSEVCYLGERLQ